MWLGHLHDAPPERAGSFIVPHHEQTIDQLNEPEAVMRKHPFPKLPSLTLTPHRMLADGEELDSVAQLATHLACQCIVCLSDYIRSANPLAESKYSSWVWLRSTGQIEVVREANCSAKTLYGEDHTSLFVESFLGITDANPTSRFYRWIEDPNGPFVGDPRDHTYAACPDWDAAAAIARPDVYRASLRNLDWQRIRIERVTQAGAETIVRKCLYRQKLAERISTWIVLGFYKPTLQRLSHYGLRDAVTKHGSEFVTNVGHTNFKEALALKVGRSLVDSAPREWLKDS
jgi:hypothetical protein